MRGGLSDGHAPIHPLDLQDIKELEVSTKTGVNVNVGASLDRLRDVHAEYNTEGSCQVLVCTRVQS